MAVKLYDYQIAAVEKCRMDAYFAGVLEVENPELL